MKGKVAHTMGVRLAKNDFQYGFAKNCGFRFGFGFTKLIAVSVFFWFG